MSKRKFLEAQRAHDDDDLDESAIDSLLKEIVQNEKESKENSRATNTTTGEKFINKQRVLILCSRGTPARYRHLMKDITATIPHSKRESKMDKKDNISVINELSQMRSCTATIYFETKKKMDCYLWIAKTPNGPSARFHLSNIHTLGELKMIGNCLKGSRPILSFDKNFDESPHWMLLKELLSQVFNTPRGHPNSKPFVDHVLSFFIQDGRIWFRHYQIAESETKKAEPELIEIGPRFVMNPIKIFSGSFQGAVLYHNPDFVSPNEIRKMQRIQKDADSVKDHFRSKEKQEKKKKIKSSVPQGPDLDQVFE